MKCEGLLDKHVCDFLDISNETAETVKFYISHYKSMETVSCHIIRPEQKYNYSFPLYIDAICVI